MKIPRASLGLCIERTALCVEFIGNEFKNIEDCYVHRGVFKVRKGVEFRVNGKFRGVCVDFEVVFEEICVI